jgi:hypothetical protein
MPEQKSSKAAVVAVLAAVLAGFAILWWVLVMGVLPLTYANARTPRELLAFLDSRRQDIQTIRVDRHLLEVGKRPSLQILRGYDKVMYQVRPHRQIHLKYRNFTRPEVMDYCTNITGDGVEELRSGLLEGKDTSPVWKGSYRGKDVSLVRVTQFTYFVMGIADKPLFMGQVELAKRLGMSDPEVLRLIIPVQERWLDKFVADTVLKASYPVQYSENNPDELVEWLSVHVQENPQSPSG